MTDLPPDPDSVPSALEAPDTSMRALLKQSDFLFFWAARFVATLAVQIQGVTIGWQVYTLARETGHSRASRPSCSAWWAWPSSSRCSS
jgi:hypothetical protein